MAETLRPARRLAVVGASPAPVCGVRDHAEILSSALAEQGLVCATRWLVREPGGPRASAAQVRSFTRALRGELRAQRPDAVLLHYSVFSLSYRGLPVFVRPVLDALADGAAPLVSVLHEFAYPWGRDGATGAAWALTQRAALRRVLRRSAAVAVTTAPRADWIGSRWWLARRPTVLTPIFSNLPAPRAAGPAPDDLSIGLFGYSYGAANAALVLDALRLLGARGIAARLMLLGAPGGESAVAGEWRRLARERGLDGALSFSGLLPAQELSDAIASCTVLLNADPAGPTTRKTTLAAALGSGRPVVALDGPNAWAELAASGAVPIVAPRAQELCEALAAPLGDEARAAALGARARSFGAEHVSPRHSAEVLAAAIAQLPASR